MNATFSGAGVWVRAGNENKAAAKAAARFLYMVFLYMAQDE
jgi:hypothetical protein